MVRQVYNLPPDECNDAECVRFWLEALPETCAGEDHERLATACDRLLGCGDAHMEDTGETRVRHLLSTADILLRLGLDSETLAATLISGCGDGHLGILGPAVAAMAGDLIRIAQITHSSDVQLSSVKARREHEENLRRLLLGLSPDIRVVLVVLAERLHLMRGIKRLEHGRRAKIAEDTRRVYAPLANRLGVWQIKWELEDLALRYLEPHEYARIAKLLDGKRDEREHYIAEVIAALRTTFADAGIAADITGRAKHIDSIWRKMQRKNLNFEQLFDVRAVRVLVEDVASCYAALGLVHNLWEPIASEFDDYIASPKANMYQSLHTAVVGPRGRPVEIQIRTYEMHRHAELGVAAHWAYKENKQQDEGFQRRIVWMREWLASKSDSEALERLRAELEPTHIYVLTPQSKVVELPKGATPVDFAYAVHSEVGNHCAGARVDGRIVPLNQRLASGQTIEILTQKNASPSRDWLSPHHGYIVTSKARNRVKQWFNHLDYDRDMAEGRNLLEREIARLGIEGRPQLEQLAARYSFRRGDDVLAAIGRGELAVGQVARQIGEPRPPEVREDHMPRVRQGPRSRRGEANGDRHRVVVEGVDDLMTTMARCCKPVPNDPIVGYVTRGRGVTIHRRDCANLAHLDDAERERLVEAHWSDADDEGAYAVDVLVIAADRKGLLRDLASEFADEDVNVISSSSSIDHRSDRATLGFGIEVRDTEHLQRIMRRLRSIEDVLDVQRPH